MNILELKNCKLPNWCFAPVLCDKDLENYNFYSTSGYVYKKISVDCIIGSTHNDYYHKSWLEMLCTLKRYKEDVVIERISHAIHDESNTKSVHEYNGKYYISAGNHRLCQAKFLGIKEVYCTVHLHEFNMTDFKLYKELLEYGFSCHYQNGFFSNIELDEIKIFTNSKNDVVNLLHMFKSIQISKFKFFRIFFLKKNPLKKILFLSISTTTRKLIKY